MNNKDFIKRLSEKTQLQEKEIQKLITSLSNHIAEELTEGDQLTIQGFGNFEIKKKLERIVTIPSSKQRMLIPPKIVINFKASNSLKEKLK